MLSLWRRHESKCPHRAKGRAWMKCGCPIWCDGDYDGRRVRQSLNTRDWARAGRKLATLEDQLNRGGHAAARRRTVADAAALFLAQREVEPSTMKKYRRIMDRVETFAGERHIASMDNFTLDLLDEYRLTRNICALSWQKELQLLRTFFEFCLDRDWIVKNPAKKMKMPPDPKPKPREPYTRAEIIQILAATSTFGKNTYERWAKAMVLLLRYYGLRVSDVASLRKDRIKHDFIFLRTVKNGAAIWLPLHP